MIGNSIAGFLGAGAAAVANSYESIATTTVGGGGAASVSFNSIPGTYKHLQIRAMTQNIYSSIDPDNIKVVFNSDTGTNYSYHVMRGNGVNVVSAGASSVAFGLAYYSGAVNASSSLFGVSIIDILDYTDTNKYKTLRSLGGFDENGDGAVGITSSAWRSTSAITDITLSNGNGNWKQYSSFALYGIKGA
jgi:hypothetical protein